MPYINIKVAGTLTKDQKQALVERITTAVEEIANKPRAATYIVIDEVSRQNWAKNGELLE